MKLIGYCLRCHKIKRVRVTMPLSGGTCMGICDNCDEQLEQGRKDDD